MSVLKYSACINELYQSEVLGEQALLALMVAAKNERDKYHFGTFVQLESETKVRLRPFLQTYSLEFVEKQEAGDELAGFVALYQQSTWQEFLAAMKPMVDQFLGRFQEMADAWPADDQDILRSMIKNEKSFERWIEKEAAAEEGSLDAAISQLQYPLTPS
jgi:hypothetical protein